MMITPTKPHKALTRSIADTDEKQAVEMSFADAELFRERATAHLQTKWSKIHTKQQADESYESPAWSEKQAAANGSLRMIEELLHEVFNVKVK